MIRISEKDLLFTVVNVITFFAWCSYLYMEECASTLFVLVDNGSPTFMEGIAYLDYHFSTLAISVVTLVCVFTNLWWFMRYIREYREAYWRDNL